MVSRQGVTVQVQSFQGILAGSIVFMGQLPSTYPCTRKMFLWNVAGSWWLLLLSWSCLVKIWFSRHLGQVMSWTLAGITGSCKSGWPRCGKVSSEGCLMSTFIGQLSEEKSMPPFGSGARADIYQWHELQNLLPWQSHQHWVVNDGTVLDIEP